MKSGENPEARRTDAVSKTERSMTPQDGRPLI
jgi:hypothetical protein